MSDPDAADLGASGRAKGCALSPTAAHPIAAHLDSGFPVSYTNLAELQVTVHVPFRVTNRRAQAVCRE